MAKKPIPKPKPWNLPSDYLRGSKHVGEKYTAWDTYNQGRPDFGKKGGPGTPYHEVQHTNLKSKTPPWALPGKVIPKPPAQRTSHLPQWKPTDARVSAIRKRLGWM